MSVKLAVQSKCNQGSVVCFRYLRGVAAKHNVKLRSHEEQTFTVPTSAAEPPGYSVTE